MARACDWVTMDALAAAGGSDFAALKLFESAPASAGVSDRVTGAVRPVNRAWSFLPSVTPRSEEHTSELQSQSNLVCRLLLEKKKIADGTCHHQVHNLHEQGADHVLLAMPRCRHS